MSKHDRTSPAAARRERRVLVALWMDGPFGTDTIEGFQERLAERGLSWRIRLATSPGAFASAARWMLKERMVDGVATRYHDDPVMAALRRAGVPSVWLGPDRSPGAPRRRLAHTAFVELDAAALARAAADHFLSRAGFRSAGFVENYWDYGWSRARGDAVTAEFRRRGLRTFRFLHRGAASEATSSDGPDFDGLAAWLRALPKPAAVVAANDDTAVDVADLCAACGIAVPRDVALLGIDDHPALCRHCDPNLSSVRFDGHEAGRLCADVLAGMMSGAPPPAAPLRYGVCPIARRASTGAVSTAGALVQKAVDFIDANACRGISLADVVRHLGVSRSLATMRFRELRGQSVLAAIEARRLAEAKRLLAGTDRRIDDIARACGYAGAGSLRRAFLAATGSTPGAWRSAPPAAP